MDVDWLTCGAHLSLFERKRLNTKRIICRTIVLITDIPVMCPTCGNRVV